MGRGKLGTGELGYNCPPFHSRGSKFSEKKLRKQVASLSINQSIEIIKIKIQMPSLIWILEKQQKQYLEHA